MNITLADRFSVMQSSSCKLSQGTNNFKEKLEDNLKNLMNKDAEKFLFMNETFSFQNNVPDISEEKLDSSFFHSKFDYSGSYDKHFNERFTETCKKFQINPLSSSKKSEDSNEEKKNMDNKFTVKKKKVFDQEILISAISNEGVSQKKIEFEDVQVKISKEKIFDLTEMIFDQNVTFISFLTNFEKKNPDKYKKNLLQMSKILHKFTDKDFINEPEKVRENLEKADPNPDFIEHYNAEMNMESSNSGLSEMKSNLSSFYDSIKKNNFLCDGNTNEEHDIFVRYYNEGLNTIEETTENFISKTDYNTNTNFLSKSANKSNITPNLKKNSVIELDPKSLSLFRYISAKCGENQKTIKFTDIVKGCDKTLKLQTFLELLKLSYYQKVELNQQEKKNFGDVFIVLC